MPSCYSTKIAYPENIDFDDEKSKELLSIKMLWQSFCSLDDGGWKFQIVSRSLFAGGLAFLFRMFVRLPFYNTMFFCAIMFTMFALMLGDFSIRRSVLVAAQLYLLTAFAFFMIAVLFQFPGLQLLFLGIFTMLLMSYSKVRLLAVMPIGYGGIAVGLQGSWYVGVNYVLAFAMCFLFTLISILLFPRSYTAIIDSLLLKYLRDVNGIFFNLVSGKQIEGATLLDKIKLHTVLSGLIRKLCSTPENDNLGGAEVFVNRERYIRLREISRGLSLLRGFELIKQQFCQEFSQTNDFFYDLSMVFRELHKSILLQKTYSGPSVACLNKWEKYFATPTTNNDLADYAFVFSSICKDVQRLIQNWHSPDTGFKSHSRHTFFCRQTRLWEAFRFTCGICLSFLIYRIFRIPYGQWIVMFTAFIYVVPQHGLVFQRINKGLAGTALGVILGFLAIELTLGYCYLWAYLFPIVILFFLYIFMLRGDFAILMVGFAASLMFSLIMSAPENSWPNMFQALGARMFAGLIAGMIVFILELFTFYNGAVIKDIRKSATQVFNNMKSALVNYGAFLTQKENNTKRNVDEVSNILAQEGAIRLFCEALEFEIGYNHQMNNYYASFIRHLHICCLYIRKIYYLSRHHNDMLSQKQLNVIEEIIKELTNSLTDAGNFKPQTDFNALSTVNKLLKNCQQDESNPVFRFLVQSLVLYASNYDKMLTYSHYLAKSSLLFGTEKK